jgi:hypothetical protein
MTFIIPEVDARKFADMYYREQPRWRLDEKKNSVKSRRLMRPRSIRTDILTNISVSCLSGKVYGSITTETGRQCPRQLRDGVLRP